MDTDSAAVELGVELKGLGIDLQERRGQRGLQGF